MVRLLVDAGADPSVKGHLAFILAASHNDADLMELLGRKVPPTPAAIEGAMSWALGRKNARTQEVAGRFRSAIEAPDIGEHASQASQSGRQLRL